jgi:hypothetical protein
MANAAGERAGGSEANKALVAKAQKDKMDAAERRGATWEKNGISSALSAGSDAYLMAALDYQE